MDEHSYFGRLSFQKRLILPIFSALIVLGVFQAGALVLIVRQRMIELKQDAIATFIANASSGYISTFDMSSLATFAKEAEKDEDVVSAEFLTPDGKSIAKSLNEVRTAKTVLEKDIKDSTGATIGKVKLGFDLQSVKKTVSRLMILIGMIALGGAGVLAALVFTITRSVTGSLEQIKQELDKTTGTLLTTASALGDASNSLSSSFRQQAAVAQETSASVEEISAMIGKTADNALNSIKVSSSSHESAKLGQQASGEMIQAIETINQSNHAIEREVEQSNQRLEDIIRVISEIRDKTKVINDIVFQTKLLSFNASVEAARAGEHGKGFAVVAEEVGKLAQLSGNAANEISAMLESSTQKVQTIISQTKSEIGKQIISATDKVDAGITVAKNSSEVLNQVVQNVETVNKMIGEISTASTEQSHGVSEITKAMQQLDEVTQINSKTSSEIKRHSEELIVEARTLRKCMASMGALVHGSRIEARSAPMLPATEV